MNTQQNKELIELLDELINANILIIVEGKKDRESLQKLGLNNIIELSKRPIFDIVEQVAIQTKECAILTDLDKKGKELYGKLSRDLQRHGVKINNRFRNFLFKNTKVRQIEGLASHLWTQIVKKIFK